MWKKLQPYSTVSLFKNVQHLASKLTLSSSSPSIAIRSSLSKFSSDNLFRNREFTIFMWLKDLSTVAVPTGSVTIMLMSVKVSGKSPR